MIEAVCHCGAVRVEVPAGPTAVSDCNCSICRRLGALWAYYPSRQVNIRAAEAATVAYAWGDKMIAFHTCRTCGCTTHWSGLKPDYDRMGVNARLFEPTVLSGVKIRRIDGADTWKVLSET